MEKFIQTAKAVALSMAMLVTNNAYALEDISIEQATQQVTKQCEGIELDENGNILFAELNSKPWECLQQDKRKVSVGRVGLVDYQPLFNFVSQPGESMDDFAYRVGPHLRAYSNEVGFEACGVIAQKDDQYSIVVGSNHGYIVCVNSGSLVVEGFQHAGATLHSHGRSGKLNPTKTDLQFMGDQFTGRHKSISVVHGQLANEFSDADYQSGAGYLAGDDGRLFYQDGRRQREINPRRRSQ